VLAIRGEFLIKLFLGTQKKVSEVISELKKKGVEP